MANKAVPIHLLFSSLIFCLLLSLLCPLSYAEDSQNNADALLAEGRQYLFSAGSDPQNVLKGVTLIHEAANAGSAQAMVEVGIMYSSGLGKLISPDFVEGTEADVAYDWFVKGAEAGAQAEAAIALSSNAFSYFLGSEDGSVVEDDAVALKYFQKAAEYGDPDAINMMVAFYTYGFGVEQDADKALELSSILADQGNTEALYSLEENAYAYYAGTKDGIDINFGNAFKYYLKLTDYGNERAMYNVGLLYEYGLGVSRDHDKALEWLAKAQDAGYEPAKVMLTQLKENN